MSRAKGISPSLRSWAAAFLFAPALLAAPAATAQTEPVFPPGSHIGMVPPEGFVVSPDFQGFMEREQGASILINELPGDAFADVGAGFTRENLAARGIELLGPCDDVTVSVESVCLRASMKVGELVIERWLLVAQFPGITAMVMVNLPEFVLTEGLYNTAEIEASLSSIAYTADLAVSPLDALPFAIEESTLLPFQQTFGGNGALYAAGRPGPGLKPLWMVIASFDRRPQARQSAFNRRIFQTLDAVSDAQITGEQALTIGALEGHLLEGSGKDSQTGSDMYVFHAIVVDETDKYYRMVGIVPAAEQETYRPEFIRLMQTFAPR